MFVYLIMALAMFAREGNLPRSPEVAAEPPSIIPPLVREEDSAKSIRLTLEEVEKSFVERNLLLLAAHYQIEAKRALVVQAGLYPKPNVFLETNIYNQQTK